MLRYRAMSRAYVIYILMFAVLAGGLWLIVEVGGAMRAPDDLAGEWAVAWRNAPPPEMGEPLIRVQQSGRFFIVRFGQRPPMSMTLQPGWKGARDGRRLDMVLAGGPWPGWKLNLHGDIPLNSPGQFPIVPELNVELIGPTRHVGHAVRRGLESPATRPAGVAHAGISNAR